MSELTTYKNVIIAKYENKIPELYRNTIKIRDIEPTNQIWSKVRMSLNACALMVGTEKPANDLYDVLKQVLINEFKDFSAEEILMSFYKKVGGKFEVKKEHYGKLSGEYLGAVLNEYKSYRHKKLAEEVQKQNFEMQKEKETSQDEKRAIHSDYLKECFIKPYNTGEKIDKHNALTLFIILMKCGAIRLTDEDKAKFRQRGEDRLKSEAMQQFNGKKHLRELVEKLQLMQEEPNKSLERKIKEAACVEYFNDYVKAMKQTGVKIETWLEKVGAFEIID